MSRRINPEIIYTTEGWLDIEYIASLECWLNVIIGPRQVGKTYGTIKYLLDHDIYHMYMRRTADELDVITEDPDLNPYRDMENEGYQTALIRQGKGWIVGDWEPDPEKEDVVKIVKRRGIGMPLSRIAKIRGFSGQQYTDVVLDEFIPEKMVVTRKAEGDAFKNALITISGNRVDKGMKPLRVWMLANSNDLFSPIMLAMNLITIVEEMGRRNEEIRVTDSGVCVVLPKSQNIIERRMRDPMLKHLNDNSSMARMAFSNDFAYNSRDFIKPKNIKGWKPYFRTYTFYVWENGEAFYVCQSKHSKGKEHGDSRDERIRCGMEYPWVQLYYRLGKFTFSDATTLYRFKEYFSIDT